MMETEKEWVRVVVDGGKQCQEKGLDLTLETGNLGGMHFRGS